MLEEVGHSSIVLESIQNCTETEEATQWRVGLWWWGGGGGGGGWGGGGLCIKHQKSRYKFPLVTMLILSSLLSQSSTTTPLLFSAEARFKIGFRIDFDRNCFSGIMSEFRPSIKSTWGEGRGKLIEGYGPGGRRFIIRGKVDCVRMAVMIWSLQFQHRSAY